METAPTVLRVFVECKVISERVARKVLQALPVYRAHVVPTTPQSERVARKALQALPVYRAHVEDKVILVYAERKEREAPQAEPKARAECKVTLVLVVRKVTGAPMERKVTGVSPVCRAHVVPTTPQSERVARREARESQACRAQEARRVISVPAERKEREAPQAEPKARAVRQVL